MKQNSARRGFTLIELLVVVLIIGILAAIALPQYNKAMRKARAAEAKLTVKAIWDAQQRKNLEMGTHNQTYNFEDLDVSFTDKDGNAATGSYFRTETFIYSLGDNRSYGGPGLIVLATTQHDNRDGNYTVEINANSEGRFVCWATILSNDGCPTALPGASEVELSSLLCSSGDRCYVE